MRIAGASEAAGVAAAGVDRELRMLLQQACDRTHLHSEKMQRFTNPNPPPFRCPYFIGIPLFLLSTGKRSPTPLFFPSFSAATKGWKGIFLLFKRKENK